MIGLVLGGSFAIDAIQTQAKESLQADLFFKSEYKEADIKQIELELRSWGYFKEVIFVNEEQAVKQLSGLGQSDQAILDILDGEKPIPANISFKPKAEYADLEGMMKIKNELLSKYPDEIEEVFYDESSVQSVNLGFKQFVYLFAVVALLLIIVAVAMINNTIRLALYSKRFTIKTMQLVGATSCYIRRPFILQSIFQGVVSAIMGLALLMLLVYIMNNILETVEISLGLEKLLLLFGLVLLIGIVISVVSTWFALNKYLRMKMNDLY
jgi:cell division transport system permease protein